MKLVSVLTPTRTGSFESLARAVRSILDAPGTDKAQVEVLLRLDDDDTQRIEFARGLLDGNGASIVGPRGAGYRDMGVFVNDLVRVADSKWCWLFDDDAWVEGNWYGQLCRFNTDCAVNSQTYKLGPSRYENNAQGGCVGLLIPTELARTIPPISPVDQVWLDVVKQKGWICNQMAGVTYHHCGRAR